MGQDYHYICVQSICPIKYKSNGYGKSACFPIISMRTGGSGEYLLGHTVNRLLIAASILAAFTACVHIFVGTAEIAAPLLNSSLAPEVSFLLYACWHLVSCSLFFSAVALFISALPRHRQAAHLLALFVSWLWLAFGAIFVIVGLVSAHGTLLFKLPQWVLLLPVGVLGLLGCASSRRSSVTSSVGHGAL